MKDLRDHIDARVEDIRKDIKEVDSKVSGFNARLTKTETDISWLHGHLRIASAIAISVISGFILYYVTNQ